MDKGLHYKVKPITSAKNNKKGLRKAIFTTFAAAVHVCFMNDTMRFKKEDLKEYFPNDSREQWYARSTHLWKLKKRGLLKQIEPEVYSLFL